MELCEADLRLDGGILYRDGGRVDEYNGRARFGFVMFRDTPSRSLDVSLQLDGRRWEGRTGPD